MLDSTQSCSVTNKHYKVTARKFLQQGARATANRLPCSKGTRDYASLATAGAKKKTGTEQNNSYKE